MKRLLCALSLAFVWAHLALAQGSSVSVSDLDPAKVDVYLLTVEVGNLVFNNFGHAALRIKSKEKSFDQVFNWGIFDFRDPLSFSYRFYLGRLRYELGVYPFDVADRQFHYEQRTVWQERINLTPVETAILLQKIEWNMRPENIAYDYFYFFDNCSTRIRDYVDQALGGSLKEAFEPQSAGRTYRDTVRSHYATNPAIAVSLDLLMNHRIDKEMNRWEEMYLPKSMRQQMLELPHEGPYGPKLLTSSETLVAFPAVTPPPFHGWAFGVFAFFLPFALGFVRPWPERGMKRSHRFSAFWFLLPTLYFSLAGFLMACTWIWSAHQDLHHNANLWFFWPTDAVLVIPLWFAMKNPYQRLRSVWGRGFQVYTLLHGAAALCGLSLWWLGLISQQIERVVIFLVPIQAVVLIFIYRLSHAKQRS